MKRFISILAAVLVVAELVTLGFFWYEHFNGKSCVTAHAASGLSDKYTDVLEDLKRDETFNAEEYPANAEDHSLELMQIAESSAQELFAYVYQPSGDAVTATTVRISLNIGGIKEYRDYELELLSSSDTLFKYIVRGITLQSGAVRYYDIPAIHRKWDSELDGAPSDDNVINEVAYEVAQLWTAYTVEGHVTYDMQTTEVITVTAKHVGYIEYFNGASLTLGGIKWEECDSHYVAFNTDRDIEKLMEADVAFVARSATAPIIEAALGVWEYGEPSQRTVTLYSDETTSNPSIGWFGEKHTWSRIQSIANFKETEKLSEETQAALEGCAWVLRFYDTGRTTNGMGSNRSTTRTDVSEVTILRLAFETDGVAYDLGVVDNKQTGDDKPDNIGSKPSITNVPWWVWLIIAVVVVVGIVLLLPSILPGVFGSVSAVLGFLWQMLLWILKGVWWLISAPVRFVVWLCTRKDS